MKLSEVAEKQLTEIRYAFGCSKQDAISHALESLHAFEKITDDQVLNYLDTTNKEKLHEWEVEYKDKRVKLENN